MNNHSKIVTVLALFGLLSAISVSTEANAHTPNTLPYGALNHQEDEDYFWHDNVLYINSVPSQGNGLFLAETDINKEYDIDDAIDRFGIDEDSTSFIVQPSIYSNVVIMYQLDDNLQFQLVDIYTDNETGFYQEVMEQ